MVTSLFWTDDTDVTPSGIFVILFVPEKVQKNFKEVGLRSIFHTTMQARDDYNRFRFRIEEIEKVLDE
ncbi:hypothetical protein RUM43_011409 [Polyplax serrata]|uniref:Uncharacterized protein n=1 Tax=Polyplax serrata TaxID=468196 RepID=A0AAN8PUL8_POLSC